MSIIMYYVADFQIILGVSGDVSPGASRQKISILIHDDAIMWLNFRLFSDQSKQSKQFRNQSHTLVIVWVSIRQQLTMITL